MARKAFVAGATKRVSHPDDTENPTVYILQCAPFRVRQWVSDHGLEVGSSVYHAGRIAALGLQVGLLGVENLLGPDDQPVSIEQTTLKLPGGIEHRCVADNVLDKLPPSDVPWLQEQLKEFIEANGDDTKKSGAPS